MPQFHRESRVVVWEGHVATPGVEQLQNGDILITARYPDPMQNSHEPSQG